MRACASRECPRWPLRRMWCFADCQWHEALCRSLRRRACAEPRRALPSNPRDVRAAKLPRFPRFPRVAFGAMSSIPRTLRSAYVERAAFGRNAPDDVPIHVPTEPFECRKPARQAGFVSTATGIRTPVSGLRKGSKPLAEVDFVPGKVLSGVGRSAHIRAVRDIFRDTGFAGAKHRVALDLVSGFSSGLVPDSQSR